MKNMNSDNKEHLEDVIAFVNWKEDLKWWRDDNNKWYNTLDEKGKIGLTTKELYEEFEMYKASLVA